MTLLKYLLLLVCVLFLVACEPPASTLTPSPTVTLVPTLTPFQPYPPPPQETPTPSPSLSIDGFIMFRDGVPQVVLSLCEIKYTEDGYRYCSYDPHWTWLMGLRIYADPVTGAFQFYGVPDGEWALVIDMVVLAVIPNYPDSDVPVIVDVKDAETVNLELYYNDPFPWSEEV